MKITHYLVVLVIMLVIDGIWLGLMVPRLYQPRIGAMLAESPRYIPALFFYLLYAFGIYYFVVSPFVSGSMGMKELVPTAIILGLLAYGTYDLTNYATLKQWSGSLTIIDMVWGAIMTLAVSYASIKILL